MNLFCKRNKKSHWNNSKNLWFLVYLLWLCYTYWLMYPTWQFCHLRKSSLQVCVSMIIHTHTHIHTCSQMYPHMHTYNIICAYKHKHIYTHTILLYACIPIPTHMCKPVLTQEYTRMGLYTVTHEKHTHTNVGCIYVHTFTYVCTHTIFQGREHTQMFSCMYKLRYMCKYNAQRKPCDFPTQNDILIILHTDTSCSKEFIIPRTDSFFSACLSWRLDRFRLNYKPICCL